MGTDSKLRIPLGTIISKELKLIGSHGMGAAAYPELLGHIADGSLAPGKFIANLISLEPPDALRQLGSFQTNPGLTDIIHFSGRNRMGEPKTLVFPRVLKVAMSPLLSILI